MKIGLNAWPVHSRFLLPAARCADELGFDSLWLGEHLVFPTRIESNYPYDSGLGPPLRSTPLHDPLITLGYIAGQTKNLQLATGVYVLPLRHPMIVAKLVATLDELAGGRVILGVGSGWLKEEFDAIGAAWERRGKRMDEMVDILRRLWTEEKVAHHGEFYQFDEVSFEPKPARAPVPIIIGGETAPALRRAARLGDGWYGTFHTPETVAERVKELRTMIANDRPFEISTLTAGNRMPSLDEVHRYRDAGVDRITFHVRSLSAGVKTVEGMLDGLKSFADTVLSRIDV
jgi:probable F420-dependent oxidoreductase